MCSVAEDSTEANFMVNEPKIPNLDGEICKKCLSNEGEVLLRRKDVYCNTCFIENVTHKFRASLGKTKIVRHGDKVLVAFSGDASSCTLIDLIKTGLKEETHKKLKFETLAVYIDEGIVFNETCNERDKTRNKVNELFAANQFPVPLYATSISNVFKTKPTISRNVNELIIHEELDNQIRQLLSSVKNLTTKQNLCKKLRQHLLLKCAKELGCKFVFLADTATKLAATLLCNISLGGGSHLASDMGFCDSRDTIKVLRPMKDFTSEELEHFISFNKIIYLHHRSLITENNPYASIQSLTNKFVKDLQENFPATISTVLRTGEKLENKSDANDPSDEDKCAMCLSLLDTQLVPCSAMQATNYSKELSTLKQNDGIPEGSTVNGSCSSACGDCHCRNSESIPSREDIEKFMCYSCRLVIKDVQDTNHIPMEILSSVRLKKSLSDTRNKIKDFLL